MDSNSFITPKVEEKFPFFIKSEYEKFTVFIKKYYEWTEQEGNAFNAIDTLSNRIDIDATDDLDVFFEQYAKDFPKILVADRKLFLKTVRDLYKSKGTEDAFRYFFRAVYGKDIEFYYPKVDILKVSDGKWVVRKSIRVAYNTDVLRISGTLITGETSGAKAYVESTTGYFIGSTRIVELFLSNIIGTFQIGETIKGTPYNENDEISGVILPIFSRITITNPGTGYSVGDVIPISGGGGVDGSAKVAAIVKGKIDSITINDGGTGYVVGDELVFSSVTGAVAAVARVSSVSSGEITGVELLSRGFNYSDIPTITVTSTGGSGADLEAISDSIGGIKLIDVINFGINYTTAPTASFAAIGNGDATGTCVTGAVCNYAGQYRNSDGFLSDIKVLQDNLYYQNYSYVIKSGIEIAKYRDTLKKTIHPAGLIFFGEISDVIELGEDDNFDLEVILKRKFLFELNYGVYLDWFRADEGFEVPGAVPSLGPTYLYFDENKYLYQNETGSPIYHFFEVQIVNFTEDEMNNAFDFIPDSEFTQTYEADPVVSFDETDETFDDDTTTFDADA